MKRITKCLWLSCLTFAGGVHAQAQFEPLARFGLQDVEKVANCVAGRVPSHLSAEFAETYWGPPMLKGRHCVISKTQVPARTIETVRPVLFDGLEVCTGRRYTSDGDPWVARVAYGAATIAAKGVHNWETGRTLLQTYVKATIECQPKEER